MIAADLAALARPIDSLHPLDGNPRRGDVDAIARSLKQFGQRKPIVARRDGTVIAGNHTLAAARQLAWAEIAVVLVDVDDVDAKAYALADNRTAELGDYDNEALVAMLEAVNGVDDELFAATAWTADDIAALVQALEAGASTQADDDAADPYTRKLNAPHYEPKGDKPATSELVDGSKTERLVADIGAADLPDDVRAFLLAAAQRHTVFRYDRIAEFYAHADPELQRLMEASALVIVDFDDAIRDGYVHLTSKLTELLDADRADHESA